MSIQVLLKWDFTNPLTTYIVSFSPTRIRLANENQLTFHLDDEKHLDSDRELASDLQHEMAGALLALPFIRKVSFSKAGMGVHLVQPNRLSKEITDKIELTIIDLLTNFKVKFVY